MVNHDFWYSFYAERFCPSLDAPINGTVTLSGNNGSVATYHCDFGFEIPPCFNSTRICTAYGQWTGTAPTCNGKAIANNHSINC